MNILANMILPLFITSTLFFILIFPAICFLEALVIACYLSLANRKNVDCFNIAIYTNAVSFIIGFLFIIIAEQFYYGISSTFSYFETIHFLNSYKLYSTLCLYLITVYIEWIIIRIFLEKEKINKNKILMCSFLANAVSYFFSVPIFYRSFF